MCYDMLYIIYVRFPLVRKAIPPKPEHLVPIMIGRVCIKCSNNDML